MEVLGGVVIARNFGHVKDGAAPSDPLHHSLLRGLKHTICHPFEYWQIMELVGICKFTLCGALASHGHCLAVAPCSGPLGSPSGSEGEPWGDSWPWCLGPGDSAALAHVGGNRRGVDLF